MTVQEADKKRWGGGTQPAHNIACESGKDDARNIKISNCFTGSYG